MGYRHDQALEAFLAASRAKPFKDLNDKEIKKIQRVLNEGFRDQSVDKENLIRVLTSHADFVNTLITLVKKAQN